MLTLTAKQAKTVGNLAKDHSSIGLSTAGPLLAVTVYVQSASSSGNTVWYYNQAGERVRT